MCLAGAFLPPGLAPAPEVQSPSSSTLQLTLPVLSMKSALQKSLWQQNSSYSPKQMEITSRRGKAALASLIPGAARSTQRHWEQDSQIPERLHIPPRPI